MKPLHTQLLPKKSTSSPSKISGSPPLISSWSRSSLMLRSEYLRWFLHEKREIPYQNQLQTWVYSRRVTRSAVIFWATAPCQNRFSVSERRINLNFALQNHLRPVSLPTKIEIVATLSERHLPTAMSKFIQGNWFWNWFWKTIGKIDLDFKWAVSRFLHKNSSTVTVVTIKIWSHQPSCNQFPKALPASSMLILSRKSDVCFAFLFCQEQGYHQFQF